MLRPKTGSKWKNHTKRIYFNRRSSHAHAPVLLFSFIGCLGDVFRARLFSPDPPKLYLRSSLRQGLMLLSSSFQIVIFLNAPKSLRLLLFQALRLNNLLPCFDAVYLGDNDEMRDFS